jgi:hypothetical protein
MKKDRKDLTPIQQARRDFSDVWNAANIEAKQRFPDITQYGGLLPDKTPMEQRPERWFPTELLVGSHEVH